MKKIILIFIFTILIGSCNDSDSKRDLAEAVQEFQSLCKGKVYAKFKIGGWVNTLEVSCKDIDFKNLKIN